MDAEEDDPLISPRRLYIQFLVDVELEDDFLWMDEELFRRSHGPGVREVDVCEALDLLELVYLLASLNRGVKVTVVAESAHEAAETRLREHLHQHLTQIRTLERRL